jgi:hypothetical protein
VPFIQYAVQNFHIRHPETKEEFPCPIPISAFPLVADESVVKWHERCAQRLKPASGSDREREDEGRQSDHVKTGGMPEMREKEKFRGVYPQTRPSTNTRSRTEQTQKVRDEHFEKPRSRPVSVAYAHVSTPHSHSGSGDDRPERPPAKPTRPGLVRSFGQRARQFLAPEDASTKGSRESERGRRRSYPEEPVSDHGPSVSHSQPSSRDRRGEEGHQRHHSVPRHRRRGSMSSDASSEAEVPTPPANDSRRRATPYSLRPDSRPGSRPSSRPTSRPVSMHEHSPHLSSSSSPPRMTPHIHRQDATPTEGPGVRYTMPPPLRPRERQHSDHNEEKRRSYVAPDSASKLSTPFYASKDRDRGSERSSSHGRNSAHLRWKDLDGPSMFPSRQNSQREPPRKSSGEDEGSRRASLSEKERDRRSRERATTGTNDRPRLFGEEREQRDQRRHSNSDKDGTRPVSGDKSSRTFKERDRDRRGGFGTTSPVRGVDGRHYPTPTY